MTRIEPGAETFDPGSWREGDDLRHLKLGVQLFNDARYEAAHEEFEQVWLSMQGGDSDFFKGLIQACIAMHHFQRGNLEGAAKLYSGHRRYLAAYLEAPGGVHRGVDVTAFLQQMQRALRPVIRRTLGESVSFDPEERPRLTLGAK